MKCKKMKRVSRCDSVPWPWDPMDEIMKSDAEVLPDDSAAGAYHRMLERIGLGKKDRNAEAARNDMIERQNKTRK